MTSTDSTIDCVCPCGATTYAARGAPLFRLVCHCSICQRFNAAPFGDVAVFRAKDVDTPPAASVHYGKWRAPPNVQRGACASCGAPAIELFHPPLLPKLTLVPVQNMGGSGLVPEPSAHVFYETRLCDVDDELPKYSGYWRSQFLFGRLFMTSLTTGRRHR